MRGYTMYFLQLCALIPRRYFSSCDDSVPFWWNNAAVT